MNKGRHIHLNNEKGFTLVELMVALVIIGILSGIAYSKFSKTKDRAYDAKAQTALHYIFKACKDYWTFNSSMNACLVSTVSDPEYGYTPPADIEIIIDPDSNNTEYDFVAEAKHTSSSKVFTVNNQGTVSMLADLEVAEEVEEEGQGNDGSVNGEKKPKKKKKKRKNKWKKRKGKKKNRR